jgi:uncharacterized damage-inducible protein DinB
MPPGSSSVPNIDYELLVAELEYARWATEKVLHAVDQLPPGAVAQPVTSSFPTLLATLQHVYGWDRYYVTHLKGDHVERRAIPEPPTYEQLRSEWPVLHREIISWAKANLACRTEAVLEGWGVWPTWMVVMQLVNHQTHHFGQVITLLRQLGYEPQPADSIDLIRYLLRRYPQENQKARVKALLDRDTTPVEVSHGD